jgi:hypothetical protein
MSFSFWLRTWIRSDRAQRRRARKATGPRVSHRPRLEALEDRTLLSNYTAATVSELIADINAANKAGGSNTITLAANTTFDLTAVNNTTNGTNGLPVIYGGGGNKGAGADNLTINGLGSDIIQRNLAAPAFRLFDVAQGASLTLDNVTLQGGKAFGSGAAADGGAIYNQGTLTLLNTIVQNNTAQGNNGTFGYFFGKKLLVVPAGTGADAEGGGIWTNGTVNLEAGTIIGSPVVSYPPLYSNQAIGGNGGNFPDAAGPAVVKGGAGGGGFGGGLYQAGGSVTITNATVVGNLAAGGTGGSVSSAQSDISGNGGAAAGGGLDVAGGTLLMSNDTVKTNFAQGGRGGHFSGLARAGTGGTGSGGGIYVGGGTVTLQAINLSSNQATGGDGGNGLGDVLLTSAAAMAEYGFGGSGLGGGLFVGGGTVTLTGSTVNGNAAYAGESGKSSGVPTASPGVASGGGISIVAPATVSLDAFTVTNTTNNYDNNWNGQPYITTVDDIDGSYTLI